MFKCKRSKTGRSGLQNPKAESNQESQETAQTYHTDKFSTDNSWFDNGWGDDGWNRDWSSVGWQEGWEEPHLNSAGSFSLGSFDLGVVSSPKRFDWMRMNLDTGAAVNTCPPDSGPDGPGDGRFCRRASGECIPDGGAWQFQGYDEHGPCRSLDGRLTGEHKVLCSAGEIACKGRQYFCLGSDGGFMILFLHIRIGKEMRTHFSELNCWIKRRETR